MNKSNIKLSKMISYILRHCPEKYRIYLDDQGYTAMSELTKAVKNSGPECSDVTEEKITEVVMKCPKGRFEIKNSKIRARWGHTIVIKIGEEAEPPEFLYHGTSPEAFKKIQIEGISRMQRNFVHFSTDPETASATGKRHSKNPIILCITAKKAWKEGVKFYKGGETIWLSKYIGIEYIEKI